MRSSVSVTANLSRFCWLTLCSIFMPFFTCLCMKWSLCFQVLKFIYASRNGLCDHELFDLIPNLTWNFWVPVLEALVERHILTRRSGLLVCAHEQVSLSPSSRHLFIHWILNASGENEHQHLFHEDFWWQCAAKSVLSTQGLLCIFQKVGSILLTHHCAIRAIL